MVKDIKAEQPDYITDEELKELSKSLRRDLPFQDRIWKNLDIPDLPSYEFSEKRILEQLRNFTPEPDLHHPAAAATAYEVKAESYEANPKPNGTACSKCCSGFLTITVQRTTAILIKNATEEPEQAQPKDKNHVNTVKYMSGVGTEDKEVIAMLEKMEWWGIVGNMTAEVMDCTAQKAQTYMSSEDKQKVADAAAVRAAVIQQAAAFETETYEPKGPPTKDSSYCRAIPAGDYKITGIDRGKDAKHSTYYFDENGASFPRGKGSHNKPLRGLNIFNDDVPSGRAIDIHVGVNADFTVGCVLLAPDLQYESLTPKKKTELFAKYRTYNAPPIKPDSEGKFNSHEFIGTKPFWSMRASLNKVTQLVELMENFRRVFQGISGDRILLTMGGRTTSTKCEAEERKEIAAEIKQHQHEKQAKKDERNKPIETAIGLDCIIVKIKNPYWNTFTDIKVLDGVTGNLSVMKDNMQISSVTIIDEGRYSVEVSGKLYELTVKKTNPVVISKKRK